MTGSDTVNILPPGHRPAAPAGAGDTAKPALRGAGTMPVAPPPQPGAWPAVPGYEILGELGRGSMGVVYKARQKSLNRLVALKMVQRGPGEDEVLRRFVEEARVVASLQHANIVRLYEISLEQEPPFFTLELVEGGSLADRLGGRPQPFRPAAQLMATLARAVQAAHEGGVVHRDLKPANILLAPPASRDSTLRTFSEDLRDPGLDFLSWTPKITDFGLAKQLDGGASRTESGLIMGTPSYMAPEQAEGKSREVGPAADVYALGAILYEMLTGRPPFAAESAVETVLQLFQMEPVAPSRLQPKLPRDLETICLKCLRKEPHKRYASAAALAGDLRRFLGGESITARPASLGQRAWKWARRRPALATLAASACLAVVGLVGLALWHQADLRASLAQSRLDERQAREAEESAARREWLLGQQDKVKDLLRAGEAALAEHDWASARAQILRARDQAGDEPELADLREQIDRLLGQVEGQQRDRERLQKFRQRRNDALFYATLYTGNDQTTSLEETRQAALEALALFGATPDREGAPAVESPHYQQQEKAEIVAGCYELLLALGEATVQPLPGESAADERGRAEQAIRILDRAAGLGLSTRAYHLRRAQYLARAGDDEAAEREHARAAALPPAGELDQFLLGVEEYRQGQWGQAVAAFEGVLQSQPQHFWGNYYLALCQLRGHRPDLAAARLTTCLGWRPDLPWLHLLRGSAWGELGQFARAEQDFEAALNGPLPEAARYGLYINRGVLRVRQGRSADALDDLGRATALRPRQYQGYVNLAQAFVRDKKFDEAVRQLDQAIEREPRLASLYATRARVHVLRQDDEAALADLAKALVVEPGRPAAAAAEDRLECGRILHRRKDYKGAVAAYDAAVALQPQHVKAHRLRAEALLELDSPAEALRSLDACLKYGPPDADVFRARAAVRMRLGDYPGAQTDYTRALEMAPDAATYEARGWAYLVAEAPALALRDFEEVIRRDPKRGDAYGGRGYARAALGQARAAAADAETALRLGPASPRLLYNAARVYARAAPGLAAEARDRRSAAAIQDSSEERAVQLLRQALEAQPPAEGARFWRAYVQNDAALRPLRAAAEFRQLAARYGGD
jgi:tetratricopeptide (TPR) repeat protein/tRNA A-37 threonylcarbamoyl transferase component Bud32